MVIWYHSYCIILWNLSYAYWCEKSHSRVFSQFLHSFRLYFQNILVLLAFGQMVLSWTKLWNFYIDHLSTEIHIYRPQTKFAKVMFLHVSVCPWWGWVGGIQAHTQGEAEGSGWGGSPGPHPGGCWGVWPGGVSRPTPRGRFVSVSVSVLVSGNVNAPLARHIHIHSSWLLTVVRFNQRADNFLTRCNPTHDFSYISL